MAWALAFEFSLMELDGIDAVDREEWRGLAVIHIGSKSPLGKIRTMKLG
jgi:hypothetical protein